MMFKISLALALTLVTLDVAYGCLGGSKSTESTSPAPTTPAPTTPAPTTPAPTTTSPTTTPTTTTPTTTTPTTTTPTTTTPTTTTPTTTPPPPQAPPCALNADLAKDSKTAPVQSDLDAYIKATNDWIMQNRSDAPTLLYIAKGVCKEIRTYTSVEDLVYTSDFSDFKKQLYAMSPPATPVLGALKKMVATIGNL